MAYSTSATTVINAPRSIVWEALTDPVVVKQYFFGTDLETSWEVGDPIYFRGEWQGKAYEDKGEVKTFVPEDSLSYTYWSNLSGKEDVPENYNLLTYTLTDVEGGTEVTIEQGNIETQETADHSKGNWEGVLKALKAYVEKEG